jgi:L-ribulose-5-phosphate 3-epimerase
MKLGASNWGFLYQRTLHEAVAELAASGYEAVELCATPPHAYPPSFGYLEARDLKQLLRRHDMTCASINPTEMNLISPNAAIRELAFDQFVDCLRVGMELEAPYLVVIPGRMNPVMPVPYDAAREMLLEVLARLVRRASEYGVQVALETSPFGFLGTGAEIAGVVDELNDPSVGITFDVANVFGQQNPADGIREAGRRISVLHVADTSRERFGHRPIGTGEVDFRAVSEAIEEVGFDGTVIYELVDGNDPTDAFRRGRSALAEAGLDVPAADRIQA